MAAAVMGARIERGFLPVVHPSKPLGVQRVSVQPTQKVPSGTSPWMSERSATARKRRTRKLIAMRSQRPFISVHSGANLVVLPKRNTSLVTPTTHPKQLMTMQWRDASGKQSSTRQ